MTILEEAPHSLSLLYFTRNRYVPKGLTRNANRIFYFDEGLIATDIAHCEGLSAGVEEPDHPGGMGMIRWPRRREAREEGLWPERFRLLEWPRA